MPGTPANLLVADLLRFYIEDSVILSDPESPFDVRCSWSDPRLTLIVGENASGKSLLARAICSKGQHDHGMVPVCVSIRERTEGGIKRAFMFGEENQHSTGGVSADTVVRAFDQKYDKLWSLTLDEPELGMSEGYAAALGQFIGERAMEPHENLQGIIVVTHSRSLVRGVLTTFTEMPTFVYMQGKEDNPGRPVPPKSIIDWLYQDDVKTVGQFMNLRKTSWDRFRTIERLLREKR